MVMPILVLGFCGTVESSLCCDGIWRFWYARAMPTMAPAALSSTPFRMLLEPAMSTMLYISVMSLSPTKGAVSPLAMVETMSLGNRNGRARRMAAEVREVPLEPPAEMTPWIEPFEWRSSKQAVAHSVMVCVT